MSITYKNKSNNIYMNNICENCIELKKDIEILNTKITCLEYDIEELKKENQELKKEIQELKKENQELKLELKYLKFDKIKYKIITAIQDINSDYNLEKITIIKKSLFKLRKYRNNYNHYIDEDNDKYESDCKKLYLLYRLKELTNDEKTIINNIFTKDEDLINEIIKYLDININKNIEINEDILFDIESWWNY